MKKRVVSLILVALISASSKSVFAVDQNSIGILDTKNPNNTITLDLAPKTIDGQKIKIPDTNDVQKFRRENNSQVKSVADNGYEQAKAVAEQKASSLISQYGSTSVQYALVDNGKIVLSGNAGAYSKEENKLLTADNMYGIASVSKMFVTTAVMKLVDEGKVNLDAPVNQYIKEFRMADDRYKKITVRMLLNHSSGLMGSCYSNALLFGDNDTYAHDTLLEQLKTQRLKTDPGTCSVYCNDGFSLAEILVEHVTGDSYTEYITKNITNTLKMNNTKTPVSKFDRDKLAKTYYPEINNAVPTENLNSIGAGGVYSSAEDLCRFATTFTQNSNKILSNNSLSAMENKEYLKGIWPEEKDNILGYGLGWDSVNLYPFNQYNIKALSKGGDTEFYHSYLTVLPEQNMAIAILSSGGGSNSDGVMAQEVLLAALKEKGVISDIKLDKTFTPPQKVAVPSEQKKYEGLYELSQGFIDVKIDESGSLILSNPLEPQGAKQTLYYTKDGTFVTSDGSTNIKFVEESNGETYLEQFGYLNLSGLGQTVIDAYVAQKEEANNLNERVSKVWEKRYGKKYYLLNEKYSSVYYILPLEAVQSIDVKGIEGYFGIDKIVDENSAISTLDGPGMMSRDQNDYKFYMKDKHEYLSAGGRVYVEEDAMKALPTKDKFSCKIGKDGYAKWYAIGDESADKKITVDIPKNAAFVVYNSNGKVLNNSLISGSNKVTLPKDGKIVFLGGSHAKFTIKYE
ncbi:serine hydrolase domain-containing protein [Clostridium sp. HBUAS56017]|uniref:serine hydrolase domain-containing protein n=1 Tax=Clostridium sp. HBUAS56017 TaxID=2571128 RepID=UPI001FAA507C|nr:serine hydrolase domain-containing protein [Clostridium sp. HBUAS56017]